MKHRQTRSILVSALLIVGGQYGQCQGTFANLDFENALLPLIPDAGSLIPITDALPEWTAYINGNPIGQVMYNGIYLSYPTVALIDSRARYFPPPIQGNYSVYLKSTSDIGFISAAVGQTAQIPSGALSLSFLIGDNAGFGVSFGSQVIPLVQFGTSGNNIIMAGDISMFAGQTGELRFVGTGLFDDIQFSNQPIPEPSTYCLFGLGAVLLGWRFLRKRV